MQITLGSLFDGIGGFPLAGMRNGMTPIWASEIEPFPIKVTKIRFSDMKHLGDITKINGAEIEPVDIVTFGSPCQDLSVAGKRAGLAGERSGLFMEAIRIIREMREREQSIGRADKHIRPRFAVWENVPGAFSSNKGEDFRAVLEETARVADKTVVIPKPPKGKWNTAGAIMGDGWSIAWRVLDAQFWGVPQRRRRIFLVADFGGQSAPEILFKRKGLRRHLEESREAREGIASDAERSPRETITVDFGRTADRITINPKVSVTIQGEGGGCGAKTGLYCIQGNCIDRADTAGCNGKGWTEDVCYTLNTIDRPAVATYQKVTDPLMANSHPGSYTGQDAYTDMFVTEPYQKTVGTLCAADCKGMQVQMAKQDKYILGQCYTVRRLTPLECERLQDYPDGWTDIPGTTELSSEELEFWREVWYYWDKLQAKYPDRVRPRRDNALLKWFKNPTSDSAQYKALGNSVAVVCPEYVLEGIKEVIERGQIC
jgi:DNA (cytosine-5)-methyltransferase 1